MFSSLFTKKKLKYPVSLNRLATDLHSHLIPGIDDGSPDLETSVKLIKEMRDLGYKKLITTPHVSSDIFKNTSEIIENGFDLLRKRLEHEKINVKIEAAAEYLIDDGFENLLKENKLRTFSKNFILIELPYFHLTPNLYEITFELQIKGYKIMMAHPERYLYWFNDMRKYEELKDRGIYFQLNMISLTGHYSSEVKKNAEKLLDAHMIDYLGSDLHNFFYLDLLKKSRFEIYLEKAIESGLIKNHLL